MRTPFHASKLGVITLVTMALWGALIGSGLAIDGPRHAETQAKHELGRLEAMLHATPHRAIALPRRLLNA